MCNHRSTDSYDIGRRSVPIHVPGNISGPPILESFDYAQWRTVTPPDLYEGARALASLPPVGDSDLLRYSALASEFNSGGAHVRDPGAFNNVLELDSREEEKTRRSSGSRNLKVRKQDLLNHFFLTQEYENKSNSIPFSQMCACIFECVLWVKKVTNARVSTSYFFWLYVNTPV